MPRDYYEVLGVSPDASDEQIKKSFRRLARELHPDVNAHDPDAEEKFKEAAEAYEVLSDSERRRTYDRFGHEGLRTGGWTPRAATFHGFEDIIEAFFGGGDPFGGMFGRRRGAAAGASVVAAVDISLAEVLTGAKREVSFEATTRCERCDGSGAEPGTSLRDCPRCGGSGQLREVMRSPFGEVMRATTCDECGGEGRTPEKPCQECHGAGRVPGTRTWEVEVPPGIEDGQRIRIAGGGHAGQGDAPTGDLFVEVRIEPDERFRREGTDLVVGVRVPATTAMLGGEIRVPTLDGEGSLEVPAGTQPGAVMRLRGHGLPPLGGGRRGDEHVVLNVVVPERLSKAQRELARKLHDSLED